MDDAALTVEQLDALSRAVPEDAERRDLAAYLAARPLSLPYPSPGALRGPRARPPRLAEPQLCSGTPQLRHPGRPQQQPRGAACASVRPRRALGRSVAAHRQPWSSACSVDAASGRCRSHTSCQTAWMVLTRPVDSSGARPPAARAAAAAAALTRARRGGAGRAPAAPRPARRRAPGHRGALLRGGHGHPAPAAAHPLLHL
jgi:hypothetical protein